MDNSLRCSFCHKSQDTVGKLISSARDYPRAYICDECVTVCMSIIEDDRQEPASAVDDATARHPLLDHPLASKIMVSLENWVRQESLGQPASEEFGQFRQLAMKIVLDA